MLRQFTASTYIFEGEKTLLLLHPKLKKWLPPGGHLEENEIPPECARREAKEETGLEVELIRDEHLFIKHWNAESFERPFLCLLENIPAFGEQPEHQHVDFIYLSRPVGGAITEEHLQMHPIRWFTFAEVMALESDVEIFAETQATLQTIFRELRSALRPQHS